MGYQIFNYKHPFVLESGKNLPEIQIAYHTYGKLNKQKNNVIWACHALTANSDVYDWWKGLFGYDNLFNPDEHFIVCANILSSHYGSSSPLSLNKETGLPYYLSFPDLTVRDLVSAHQLLAEHLEITEIGLIIGGSLGGQQALEWAIMEPERIERLVLLATNAVHSSWGIAFNESQRLAITADRTFYSMSPDGGSKGLKAARSMALLSYRNYHTYKNTQKEDSAEKTDSYKASSYQNYQGEKLVNRFNAFSYYYLSKTMDSHHVGRTRGSIEQALELVRAKTVVIGISSDVLFPVEEQIYIANTIPDARFVEIDSLYGHDGFLIETEIITQVLSKFLKEFPLGKSENNLYRIE